MELILLEKIVLAYSSNLIKAKKINKNIFREFLIGIHFTLNTPAPQNYYKPKNRIRHCLPPL